MAGLGCAGMSLLMQMIASGQFADKKILAIDRSAKTTNDRTWCFWEETPGPFEDIVCKTWDSLRFCGGSLDKTMNIRPFRYKMIRGIDFYRHCLAEIARHTGIRISYGTIESIHPDAAGGLVRWDGNEARAKWIFNGLTPSQVPEKGRHHLLQHFLGWEIRSVSDPVFDPATATLMDFRVDQQDGTAFVYIMPFTPHRALVEYTVFSEALLAPELYADRLKTYIRDRVTAAGYSVEATEYGVIPMTDQRFSTDRPGITHIGTAGNQTKASSGYTFSFIQQQSARLVREMITHGHPQPPKGPGRFGFYDSVLLNVLQTGKLPGEAVFARLFGRNRVTDILPFLANASRPQQELGIIASLPLIPFVQAGWQEFFRRLRSGS